MSFRRHPTAEFRVDLVVFVCILCLLIEFRLSHNQVIEIVLFLFHCFGRAVYQLELYTAVLEKEDYK